MRRLDLNRNPAEPSFPTAREEHRGQVRILSGNGTSTKDELWLGRNDAGTNEWVKVTNADDLTAQASVAESLTNKTIAGNTNTISIQDNKFTLFDNADATKQVQFDLVNISAGTTRVLILPNVTAVELVATTAAQTLSNKTLTTPTIGDLSNANHAHTNAASGGVLTGYSQDRKTGIFMPPFFIAAGTAATAAPASNQTNAIYLGVAPFAITSVVVRMRVTTAYVAGTWAELGIATGAAAMGGNASLTRRGFTNVASTFNALGVFSTTISVSGINAGDDVWLLWGSQGGTAFVVRGGIMDDLTAGFTQFAGATRISTMGAGTAFTASASATLACWAAIQWS